MSRHGPTAGDLAVGLWTALCLVLALLAADRVQGLGAASADLGALGRDVEAVGAALGGLDLPVVGGPVEEAAEDVRRSGAAIAASAGATGRAIDAAAVVIGLAIALLPVVPVLVLHVHRRTADLRHRRALARLLAGDHDAGLDRLLAHRHLMTSPYDRLAAMGGRPWEELAAGRYARLAEAERSRAGVPEP